MKFKVFVRIIMADSGTTLSDKGLYLMTRARKKRHISDISSDTNEKGELVYPEYVPAKSFQYRFEWSSKRYNKVKKYIRTVKFCIGYYSETTFEQITFPEAVTEEFAVRAVEQFMSEYVPHAYWQRLHDNNELGSFTITYEYVAMEHMCKGDLLFDSNFFEGFVPIDEANGVYRLHCASN